MELPHNNPTISKSKFNTENWAQMETLTSKTNQKMINHQLKMSQTCNIIAILITKMGTTLLKSKYCQLLIIKVCATAIATWEDCIEVKLFKFNKQWTQRSTLKTLKVNSHWLIYKWAFSLCLKKMKIELIQTSKTSNSLLPTSAQ